VKEVGHIFLSWRQGFGKPRHLVGVLKRNSTDGVRFSYLSDGFEEAKGEGFTPYTEFPNIDKVYSENVVETFGQRITKSERSDILDFLDFWEIDSKYKDDKFYLLAHTQGLSPVDNFEFLADYNPSKELRFLTDLAGLSVLKLPANTLKVGDILTYELETENKFDSSAVGVFKDNIHVGYIKKVHNRVFHKKGGQNLKLKVKALEQNGIVKRVFVKVFV